MVQKLREKQKQLEKEEDDRIKKFAEEKQSWEEQRQKEFQDKFE